MLLSSGGQRLRLAAEWYTSEVQLSSRRTKEIKTWESNKMAETGSDLSGWSVC